MGYEQIGPAIGTLGSLIMGLLVALQMGRRKANIWEGILALIGILLISTAFFLQYGSWPLWTWIVAAVVGLVFAVAVIIVFCKQKKDC